MPLNFREFFPYRVQLGPSGSLALRFRWLNADQVEELEQGLKSAEAQARGPVELTDADKAALSKASNAFAQRMLREHVRIDAGEIRDDGRSTDETPVWIEQGEMLMTVFGGRPEVPALILASLLVANRVSPDDRKNLPSLLVSLRTSPEQPKGPTGDAPAPTVRSAAPSTSAALEAVTDASNPASSGTTDPSSFTPVPSESCLPA